MPKRNFKKNKVATILIILLALRLFVYRIKENLGDEIQTLFNKASNLGDEAAAVKSGSSGLGRVEVDTSLVEVNEEFFNSMSEKELIHYKMINSIDFFETVEGEIYRYDMFDEPSTEKYIIDLKNNRSRTDNSGGNGNYILIFNDYVCRDFYEDNTYREIKTFREDEEKNKEKLYDLKKLKPKQRYGQNDVILNRRTGVIVAADSIMGEEHLIRYLRNYDSWDIAGEEEFVGRKCKKIVGDMGFEDTKSKANNYMALLDAETGVVLKLDKMTSDGTVVSGFETKYIKYNETYDEELFDTSTEGYKPKYP